MLKPTRSEITAQTSNLVAGGHLSSDDQKDVCRLISQHPDYKADPIRYSDLPARVEAVVDYDAKWLLACVVHVDAAGQDHAEAVVDGTTVNTDTPRVDWVSAMFGVLYPPDDSGAEAASQTISYGQVDAPCGWYSSWYSCCDSSVCLCGREY